MGFVCVQGTFGAVGPTGTHVVLTTTFRVFDISVPSADVDAFVAQFTSVKPVRFLMRSASSQPAHIILCMILGINLISVAAVIVDFDGHRSVALITWVLTLVVFIAIRVSQLAIVSLEGPALVMRFLLRRRLVLRREAITTFASTTRLVTLKHESGQIYTLHPLHPGAVDLLCNWHSDAR
jgi:hypothetical protein